MGCGASAAATSNKEQAKKAEKETTPQPSSNHSNNEDIRDKYDLGKILGSGSFGQVREAILKGHPDAEMRAVKMIERDNEDGEWSNQAIFVREVALLQQIDHQNIIRYYDFYEDLHFLYVVMELCKGGEVFAKIVELKRFSEKNAAVLGQQMLQAIDYIHKRHIAHRDIKAENFMLAEPSISSSVKMIDFGMACKFEDGECLTELCGSPHYLAPELIGQKYDHRADVWAFGVLLYLLMYGHYPYDAKHPRDIMVKILTEPIRWQTKVKLSNHGLDFLRRLLEHDLKKRMSAEEALNHPWMRQADTESLPTEVIRSAHKKVTATRKTVDPKVEDLRNQKLAKIDEDFKNNIRYGKRLGPTPVNEAFMHKPEFQRHANKTVTAPSTQMVDRRTSLKKMLDSVQEGGPGSTPQEGKPDQPERKQVRSISVTGPPRRLSYIGALTYHEEKNLASLYAEKMTTEPAKLGVVPEPQSGSESISGGKEGAATAGLSNALDEAEAKEETAAS
jgi:myosin-light-chain kinase